MGNAEVYLFCADGFRDRNVHQQNYDLVANVLTLDAYLVILKTIFNCGIISSNFTTVIIGFEYRIP